jgi:hypothetical protein
VLEGRSDKVLQCQQILARLQDDDLASWGFARNDLAEQLAAIPGSGGQHKGPGASFHTLERRVLVALRRNIHHNALGRLVRSLRNACDVLLR